MGWTGRPFAAATCSIPWTRQPSPNKRGQVVALFLALPITSVFAGPSASLNYFPGSGASGAMDIDNMTISISTGTDNLGVNLVYSVLYPSANVNFSKIDITAIQANQTTLPTTEVLYTEPIGLVAFKRARCIVRVHSYLPVHRLACV